VRRSSRTEEGEDELLRLTTPISPAERKGRVEPKARREHLVLETVRRGERLDENLLRGGKRECGNYFHHPIITKERGRKKGKFVAEDDTYVRPGLIGLVCRSPKKRKRGKGE